MCNCGQHTNPAPGAALSPRPRVTLTVPMRPAGLAAGPMSSSWLSYAGWGLVGVTAIGGLVALSWYGERLQEELAQRPAPSSPYSRYRR